MDQNKVNRKQSLSEYLSEDILEENFINVFVHYLSILKVLGLCRVDARDRFISAPTIMQKSYTLLCIIAAITEYAISTRYAEEHRYGLNLLILLVNFQSITYYISVAVHARFTNSEGNAKLYLKMQRIDRLMGMQRHPTIYKMNRVVFLVFLYFAIALFLTTVITFSVAGIEMLVLFFRTAIFTFVCIMDISYCSNLIVFFDIRLVLINSIVLNYVDGEPVKERVRFNPSKLLRQLAAESYDFQTCEVEVYLKELIECFYEFRNLHQLPIALYIANFFTILCMNSQYMITQALKNELTGSVKFLVLTYIAKLILHLYFLCIRFEFFFRGLKENKRLLTAVMSYHFEGPLYEKARYMYKLLEEISPGFSVYGLWQLDANFLIAFFNISTTMFFTLLQFALL